MQHEDYEESAKFRSTAKIPRKGEWQNGWDVKSPIFRTTGNPLEEEEVAPTAAHVRVDDLTEEQKRAFDKIVEWQDRGKNENDILKLGGYAGTGKSTLLSLFAELSREAAFCCFTAKATDVLRKKMRQLGMPPGFLTKNVSTIHGLIYIPIEGKKGEIIGWEKCDANKVRQQFRCIVVDEASMVNGQMLDDIKSFGLPILAVGDHGQLPPVQGEGALMLQPDVKLETIHRQAKDNPIIALAHSVRQDGRLPRHDTLAKDGPIKYVAMSDVSDLLKQLYEQYQPNDIALLTYTNATRQKLNRLGRTAWLGKIQQDDTVVPGEQVICLKNYKRVVFNGMRGTAMPDPAPKVANKHWYDASVEFPEHELVMDAHLLGGQFGRNRTFGDLVEVQQQLNLGVSCWPEVGMLFDYGYALTVHKSQGSGFKAVILKYERPGPVSDDDFRRWLYTAVTRAIDKLYIVV